MISSKILNGFCCNASTINDILSAFNLRAATLAAKKGDCNLVCILISQFLPLKMLAYLGHVTAALQRSSVPEMFLIRHASATPELLEPCGQLKIKGGKPRFIVDDWNVGAGAGDPILTELQSLLQPLGVDVHVSNTPWRFFLSNCNSRVNGYQIRYDHHIQSCLKSDDALFDRQLESVQALLDLNAPRVVIITEPYGFGKTRVSAVAACCRL